MAAAQYYNPSSFPTTTTAADLPLKPMHLATSTVSIPSAYSTTPDIAYNPVAQHGHHSSAPPGTGDALSATDRKLKHTIRMLKLWSRILGTMLSGATLVPLAMTVAKFLATKDEYFTVDGTRRTAWAHDSITWYTYMYAAVAAVSTVLNAGVLAAYARGVKAANRASDVAGWWTWGILAAHVVVWCVSAGLYRYGKEPKDGKFRDLWGWTCSAGAKELQAVLTNVDFEKYCGVQSSSFYIGVANIVTGLLSAVILVLAVMRRRSKKKIERIAYQPNYEPLRQ